MRKYLEKSALPKITKKCQKKWQKRAEIFRLPLITIYKLVFCKKCEFGYIKNCGCSVSLSVCGDRVDYGAAVELLQPKIMLPPNQSPKLLLFVFGGLNRLHLGPSFAKFRHMSCRYICCVHQLLGAGICEQLHELQLSHWWPEFVSIATTNQKRSTFYKSAEVLRVAARLIFLFSPYIIWGYQELLWRKPQQDPQWITV